MFPKCACSALALLLLAPGGAHLFAQNPAPVPISGTVFDAGGNPANTGTVVFILQPQSSSIQYYIQGMGTIAPQRVTCTITTGGTLLAQTGGGPCVVWGNDVIAPANTTYQQQFMPNGIPSSTIQQTCIGGNSYSINSPKFCPVTTIIPQYNTITTPNVNANIVPAATGAYTLGNAQGHFASLYVDNIFCTPGGTGCTGNTPGGAGADEQVIYNKLGVPASDSKFMWDYNALALYIGGKPVPTPTVTIGPQSPVTTSWKLDLTSPATALSSIGACGVSTGCQGAAPAGANGEVQINEGGHFSSVPGFVYTDSPNNYLNGLTAGTNGAGITISANNFNGNNMSVNPNGGYQQDLLGTLNGHVMACIGGSGLVQACATNAMTWSALNSATGCPGGVCQSTGIIVGSGPCLFDNTPAQGHLVVLSTTVAGECHDTGQSVPPIQGVLVGQVSGAPNGPGTEAPVFLMRTAPNHGSISFSTTSTPASYMAMRKLDQTPVNVDNVTVVINAWNCTTNPQINLLDCADTTCNSQIVLSTIVPTGTGVITGTLTQPNLIVPAGNYLVWSNNVGACTSFTANGTATF